MYDSNTADVQSGMLICTLDASNNIHGSPMPVSSVPAVNQTIVNSLP